MRKAGAIPARPRGSGRGWDAQARPAPVDGPSEVRCRRWVAGPWLLPAAAPTAPAAAGPLPLQAELASGAFPDQGEVEIFFSAHGVPVSYIEEGE